MVKKLGFNKKYYNFLIIVGIIIIVSLLLVFILIKPKANKKTSNRLFQNRELFTGIPSDAVMVFYFDFLSNYESILKDTNSFAYVLFLKNNPKIINQLILFIVHVFDSGTAFKFFFKNNFLPVSLKKP